MIRRAAVLLLTAMLALSTGAVARAQTNYPAEGSIEVRDANGNIVSANAGLRPGDDMVIYSTGWIRLGPVDFNFLSDPIYLGTEYANVNGEVRATYKVPDVEPGMHTLRLTGTGANGQPRTVDYPIRVLPKDNGGGNNGGNNNGGGGNNGGNNNTGGGNNGGNNNTGGGNNGGNNNTGGVGANARTGSQVLGSSLDRSDSPPGVLGAFGKTGADQARALAAIGFALFALGAALVLAVKRSREAAPA